MDNDKVEALQTAKGYIDNLKEGAKKIYNYISNGEEVKALELIPYFTEGIDWLVKVILLTRDVQKKEINIDGFNSMFTEVTEALKEQDHILVGDFFQHEIIPRLDNIQNDISKAIEI
ncbi:hypothetical protein BD780_002405 [Clostridium tetanomorphum]|uniref:hypothetical protein n=1 Tax=Clostridium tetanomorphum TaxID=1553 RepID=UPI00044DEB03|nr:hypothetical protein [Clostridium tetanomorphum]KAJ52336.1 hypothetical protein CTM_08361 [Clostridium tetanomorphum DSM 665]MBP1865257.1 hypothetical protein [Clostridium tetanomorphum]NRS85180.1 hypothetical protein [Clostridium tetanomorphum]SQC03111.1 Uncharacterised protein [Clostridium tetanomorphum]